MNACITTPALSLEITPGKRRHSNMAPALILLPKERRRDAFLFYDFCRTVDDIADTGTVPPEQRLELLDLWKSSLQPQQEKNLPPDFLEMILRRNLDRELLAEILNGMRMDIPTEADIIRYSTFDDLHRYCWRVASAVGLVSASIFGAQGEAVERYAAELGIALQLTNILRDVAEDAAMNRIYLPLEDLERFSVKETQILTLASSTPEMTHLLNHQAERADSYFAKAELAWSTMSRNQRRLMRPARLMSSVYRELLLHMHRERYDVFQKKYRVPHLKKIFLIIQMIVEEWRSA